MARKRTARQVARRLFSGGLPSLGAFTLSRENGEEVNSKTMPIEYIERWLHTDEVIEYLHECSGAETTGGRPPEDEDGRKRFDEMSRLADLVHQYQHEPSNMELLFEYGRITDHCRDQLVFGELGGLLVKISEGQHLSREEKGLFAKALERLDGIYVTKKILEALYAPEVVRSDDNMARAIEGSGERTPSDEEDLMVKYGNRRQQLKHEIPLLEEVMADLQFIYREMAPERRR